MITKDRKPVDPALRTYLDAIAPPPPAFLVVNDNERALMRRALMLQALESRSAISGLPNGVQTREIAISNGFTGRIYTPSLPTAMPVLVYAHGGGWVAGSIETHDPFCRLLCEASGLIVLSVEYRLAPEYPFPAALDDVLSAYEWATAHGGNFGANPRRLLLGGDSAGANLAAVTANSICARNQATRPEALMLLYPVTDHPNSEHASYTENATGYGLEASLMRWFWDQYAQGISPDNPKISPLRKQNVPTLPPTLVATAEYDPLRDEGVAYAEKLAKAGISVTHMHAPDMHHNFPVHPGTVARFPQCIAALNQFAEWLRSSHII